MNRSTIFNSPIALPIFKLLGKTILKVSGWQVKGKLPTQQVIVIAAPHTSNWDFPLAMAAIFSQGWQINWIGKDSLFNGFFGKFMYWLGGMPVDRSKANNTVELTAQLFTQQQVHAIGIAPEGTRKKVDTWKSGFYYIALAAKIDIALGYIDSKQKEIGIGIILTPSGDIAADFEKIRDFYCNKIGIKADNFSPPKIKKH